MSIMPFIIIGGLLYAAFYIKPKARGTAIPSLPIESRDRFYGIAVPAPTVIWAVGTVGKVVRSEDNGKSWVVQPVPLKVDLQGIAAWDALRAVVVGDKGVVTVTRDGGKSWTEVKAPLSEVANKLMRVKIFADGSVWAVGEMGAVLHSNDSGSTWERALPEEDVGYNDICFVGPNGWLVGEFGRMKRTDDGGKTWKNITSGVETSLMSVAFKDDRHGVAVGLEGVVLVTEDGGSRWAEAPKVTPEHLFHCIRDGSAWVAVGDKGIIVRGDPSGMVWKPSRMSDVDLSWHTEIVKMGDRYYVAGASLGVLEKGKLKIFGRDNG